LLTLLEPDRYSPESEKGREEFRTLYSAQSDIGRRLRRLSRRVESVASGESAPEEVIRLAQTLLDLQSLQNDEQLRANIASLSLLPQNFIENAREVLHHVADRYRINRRILRNRRQRLVEEGQLEPIERKFAPLSYQPEQLEIEVTNAVEAIISDLGSKDISNDLLISFARVVIQSLVVPSTVRAFLERLMESEEGTLNNKGRDFVSMGHMFGYEDWEDYADLLCMGVRPYVSEELIARAVGSATAWQRSKKVSSRFARLVSFLKIRQQDNVSPKLLIFVGFPGAVEELAEPLRNEFGNASVREFRYGLTQEEKEQNARQFQTNSKTWLLVSDETGGEGRNFQFSSELIHFDTPWYAARVEQRIGRLDRLGRERVRSDVVSNVLFSEGSIEHALVNSYREGLKIYDRSISGLEFALRDVEQRIVEVALEGGPDGLFDHVAELGELAEREREQDESEAVLDEASFELKTAERFRRVSHSLMGEKLLEESFVDYFRLISSARSAKEWHDPAFPIGIWKFSADDARIQLPLFHENKGVIGDFIGTFRREIAQQRPELNFFNVGNPFFDAVITSLGLHSAGRTYAVGCDFPGRSAWTGFEFSFRARPDLKLLEGNYGLANQALSLFTLRPVHFFFTCDGEYFENGEELLAIRKLLKPELKDRVWWNLTKERAQLLPQVLGGRDWQDTVFGLYKIAQEKALEVIGERLTRELEKEIGRIAEHMRQLRRRPEESGRDEITSLQLLAMAIDNWNVELDGLGFLSVNGINLG